MKSRYITEAEMDAAVLAMIPLIEMNHLTRGELVSRALEHFADELGVWANDSAARVIASRVLMYWDCKKMEAKREVTQ